VFSGGIASINVGMEGTPFDVHVELLCDRSPFFNRVFGERYNKPLTEDYSLPDDDPNTFTEFVRWVYQGTIFQDQAFPSWIQLCRLWVLARKLEVPRLQNIVMTACKNKLSHEPGVMGRREIKFVYNHTDMNNPLRRMVVDTWVGRMKEDQFESLKTDLPRPFLEDLCSGLFERVENSHEERDPLPQSDFDKRYYVDENSSASGPKIPDRNNGSTSPTVEDYARLATPEQMANRKILRPRSRSRSTETREADTKASAIASTDVQMGNISSELGRLKM
jgi:hypothetical protein